MEILSRLQHCFPDVDPSAPLPKTIEGTEIVRAIQTGRQQLQKRIPEIIDDAYPYTIEQYCRALRKLCHSLLKQVGAMKPKGSGWILDQQFSTYGEILELAQTIRTRCQAACEKTMLSDVATQIEKYMNALMCAFRDRINGTAAAQQPIDVTGQSAVQMESEQQPTDEWSALPADLQTQLRTLVAEAGIPSLKEVKRREYSVAHVLRMAALYNICFDHGVSTKPAERAWEMHRIDLVRHITRNHQNTYPIWTQEEEDILAKITKYLQGCTHPDILYKKDPHRPLLVLLARLWKKKLNRAELPHKPFKDLGIHFYHVLPLLKEFEGIPMSELVPSLFSNSSAEADAIFIKMHNSRLPDVSKPILQEPRITCVNDTEGQIAFPPGGNIRIPGGRKATIILQAPDGTTTTIRILKSRKTSRSTVVPGGVVHIPAGSKAEIMVVEPDGIKTTIRLDESDSEGQITFTSDGNMFIPEGRTVEITTRATDGTTSTILLGDNAQE